MNLSQRSYEPELLDRSDIPFEDIRRNMQELDTINTWLGGHAINIMGLKSLMNGNANMDREKQEWTILEIGCGGGDNLRALKRYLMRREMAFGLTGVDINPHCIQYARTVPSNNGIHFITSDYALLRPDPRPDFIFASLFCHHFNDEELQNIFRWMHENCRKGFFINDLHRHPLAFHSIRILTRLFSKSYMVKNDAPLSVRRGFRRNELQRLLEKAGVRQFRIEWKWAFRWLVTVNRVN